MEYKRLNTLIHSIEQVKLLAMSMYQISDETEFRKYFLTLALQMERLTNETRTATVLDADIDRKFYLSEAAESLDISVRKCKDKLVIILPYLLPKQQSIDSDSYIIDPLVNVLKKYVDINKPKKLERSLVVVKSVYSPDNEKLIRDNDNIEIRHVINAISTLLFVDDNMTLTQAYSDISFTVKDSAGKYITAVYKGTSYSYTGVTTNASNATKFVFNGGNTSGIKISDMPFGTYSVTEVTGNKVKGQGFRVQESTTKKVTTSYNISSDTVTGGSVRFVNVKQQYVGLRIYKTFTNNEGESINVSNRIYDQVEFSVKDENGNDVEFVMQNKNAGAYTVYRSDYANPPQTAIKLGTDTRFITITGLEAGKTYTVTEKIAGSDLKKICVCKSLFTVEGAKENAVIYAPDDAVVQSGTVTMPAGENSIAEVHFENTYKTTEIEIIKESDDDLVERKFAVTTTNYDLYPENDPLYVMSEVRTGTDGKVRGIAVVKDLPLAYYDHDTDSIVKIQYKIEEVDTPEYYEIPAAQTIIPMDGQKSVTIKNKLKTGTIKVIKKAEVNGSTEIIPLAGIEFSLKNSYNKTVLTAVTDTNGEILFENLPIAVGVKNSDGSESIKKIRYTVSEIEGENNEKYVLADDQTLTLDYTKQANQRIKTLQVLNTPITGNVFLEKADARTLELLSGAEFTIYKDVNGNGKYDNGKDTLATG